MSRRRQAVGAGGERLAAAFLARHGVTVVDRNVSVDRGELDVIATSGGRRLVIEVRTITGPGDPLDAFDAAKRRQVGRLAGIIDADRVDLLAIRLGEDAAEFRWVKGAA